jgi:GDSL-like lipase/acylhydrolase family protein
MPARRRPRTRQLLLAAVCALATLAFALPAQAAGPRYVALGDSYSAASGVLPPDLSAPLQCLRSTRNYPHVIAAATGAQLVDVTCGAAETSHYFESQYPGVAPQLDALKADTQLVTMTIGGNDSGVFINAILSCGAAGILTLGQGSPCKNQYGSSFEDTINTTTYPSLVKALTAVRAKSPNAKVGILGYPWIMQRRCPLCTRHPGHPQRRRPPRRPRHRRHLRQPEQSLRRPRRLPADRHPLGRARPPGHQPRDRPPQRPRRVRDGGPGDQSPAPALNLQAMTPASTAGAA